MADQFSASQIPFIEYEVAYQTDKLGKIGPWDMRLAIGGFTGKSKHIYANPANTGYGGQYVKSWGVNVKGFLPIIAEKSGNKKGALSINDLLFEALFRSPVNLHQFFQICKTTIKRICCIGNIEIRMLLIGE